MAEPTDNEIQEELDKAVEHTSRGQAQWPGMSYEQGVQNALEWVLGDIDDKPMDP